MPVESSTPEDSSTDEAAIESGREAAIEHRRECKLVRDSTGEKLGVACQLPRLNLEEWRKRVQERQKEQEETAEVDLSCTCS